MLLTLAHFKRQHSFKISFSGMSILLIRETSVYRSSPLILRWFQGNGVQLQKLHSTNYCYFTDYIWYYLQFSTTSTAALRSCVNCNHFLWNIWKISNITCENVPKLFLFSELLGLISLYPGTGEFYWSAFVTSNVTYCRRLSSEVILLFIHPVPVIFKAMRPWNFRSGVHTTAI
jgi:hypothetical protein